MQNQFLIQVIQHYQVYKATVNTKEEEEQTIIITSMEKAGNIEGVTKITANRRNFKSVLTA